MAAWQKERRDTEREEALQPEVRNATLLAYLGPLIVIFVIVGIALLYWTTGDATRDERVEPTVGTSGEATPGGGDPGPKPDNTQEERDSRQDAR